MATEQSMPWEITQTMIEATRATIMAMREADIPTNNARPMHTMPRSGCSVQRQPLFDWKAAKNIRNCATFR